jgi:hypothetical protein
MAGLLKFDSPIICLSLIDFGKLSVLAYSVFCCGITCANCVDGILSEDLVLLFVSFDIDFI